MLQKTFAPEKLLLQLITRKIEALGIVLTEAQKKSIGDQLQQNDTGSFKLDFTDEQVKALKVGLEDNKTLVLKFEENELPDINNLARKVIQEIISICQTEVADILVQDWKAQSSDVLKVENANLQSFNNRISSFWGSAIDSLQMLLGITNVNCSEICNNLWQNATLENSHVIQAITRLHARGCQVAFEIVTLLRSGCADGAQARWRTLHEIAVIANFLHQSGNDIANRYLLHVDIETYRAADAYQTHCETIHYDPIPEDEFAALESRREELLAHFGSAFGTDYGWAKPIFPHKTKL